LAIQAVPFAFRDLEIGHLWQGQKPSDGLAKISLDIPEVFL